MVGFGPSHTSYCGGYPLVTGPSHPMSKRIKKEKGKNVKSFVKDETFKGYMKSHTINSEKNENDVDMAFDICKTQLGKFIKD